MDFFWTEILFFMRYFSDLTGKRTKLGLSALAVGLLFCMTSCVTLRDAEAPPETRPVQEPPEITAPVHDFSPPETEAEPEVYPEYERTVSAEAAEWVSWYEDTYGSGSADKVLLDRENILRWNRQMTDDTPTMRDMTALPAEISGAEVRAMIEAYELPAGERYVDGHTPITSAMRDEVYGNRNLDNIPETVQMMRAIITTRADLKKFPTELTFHTSGDTYYDGLQETELIAGFPVVVLHTSADGNFAFVLSYHYSGWIPAENAAYCTEEEYRLFAEPEDSVTVLAKMIDCGGVRLDMGAALPYTGEGADSYTVQVPKRHPETGMLTLEDAEISKNNAVRGVLEYTIKNYYRQAFLYLGTDYGWGGADGGVDCSGFVGAVFRTFGLHLPRNTGELSKYAGMVVSLADDPSGVLDTVKQPAAVYRPGHVMLYLGKRDGRHTIIHAPQGGEKVCVAELSMANLTGVSVFVK